LNSFQMPSMKRSTNSPIRNVREKLRFGLVGAGAIAQSYLQAFEHCSEARLVAVADCRVDAAQTIAERMRCRSYDAVEKMIGSCQLDAAIVCTPPVTHPEICIRLMEAGIHVLCEKPFSIDMQGAQRMLETARRTGVNLTMASKFRYVEDIIRAKSIVTSGVLGDLILFENVFAHRVDMKSRWNSRREISGGGVLIDNGTHSVDLMHHFLGPLAEVQATEAKRSHGLPVEETLFLLVRSVSGVLCKVDLSWAISRQNDSFLNIYGTRGTVSVGWKRSSRLDFAHHERISIGNGYNKIQAFRSQIENFSRAVRGEEELLITALDAIDSVNIIECAYRSLGQNKWVQIANTSQRILDSLDHTFTDSSREKYRTLH
jgi:predicted dehydrogenase